MQSHATVLFRCHFTCSPAALVVATPSNGRLTLEIISLTWRLNLPRRTSRLEPKYRPHPAAVSSAPLHAFARGVDARGQFFDVTSQSWAQHQFALEPRLSFPLHPRRTTNASARADQAVASIVLSHRGRSWRQVTVTRPPSPQIRRPLDISTALRRWLSDRQGEPAP